MTTWQFIKQAFIRSFQQESPVLLALWALCLVVGGLMLLANAWGADYRGLAFLPEQIAVLCPAALLLFGFNSLIVEDSPRLHKLLSCLNKYILTALALFILILGAAYTPFPRIDHALLLVDQWIGFDSLSAMAWTHQYPSLHAVLVFAYEQLNKEMFILPFILLLLGRHDDINQYFSTNIIAAFIGLVFYYFFPNIGPATVLKSTYFLPAEHMLVTQFHEIHHHLPVLTHSLSLIACPSFHIIWAIVAVYYVRRIWWLAIPLALFNVLMLPAILLLGWHYLIDAIAAVPVAIFAIYLSHRLNQRYPAKYLALL